MKHYDLVTIGTGTASQVASTRVRASGRSVAVIDHRPFGGTCALRGCDPKKMLRSAAEVVDFARRMRGRGIDGESHIDWAALMAFKRSFTAPIPKGLERNFSERGIDAFKGAARFVARDAVEVAGTELSAAHFLIATGARPAPLGIDGEELVSTSDEFLDLDELPRRIVLIGGGYIAAEFSHIAARAGAKVTILQRGPRLLPQFDPALVEWLTDKFREIGIVVQTYTFVVAVDRVATGLRVHALSGGSEISVEADLVVHAAGRTPDIASIGIEAASVAVDKGRLKLNEFLQSVSNPLIYAAGDAAASGPPLTPVSSHDGKVVAANILHGNSRRPDYRGVPSVAFTLPPIAKVGMTEAEAQLQGIKTKTKCERAGSWYTAMRVAEKVYGYKTIIEEGTDRILGAHLVGPGVDEVINVFALAIRHEMTVDDLKTAIFAYPSGASDVGYMF